MSKNRQFHPIELLSVQQLPGKPGWIELVNRALTNIKQQHFKKVVLARCTILKLADPMQPALFLAESQRINHQCYHFMLAFSSERAFLASTPERLFYRHHQQLITEALAGTVANVDSDADAKKLAVWLTQDKKNQYENILVVNDICQRLQPLIDSIDIQDIDVIRLRKVQHLRRIICAQLQAINDLDCLTHLQPTAAVAGLPRQSAFDFILNNEPFSRDWYAGSGGYLSQEKTELAVSLRSALVEYDEIYLYAGAGIVTGSDPQHEWDEINSKLASLLSILTSTTES